MNKQEILNRAGQLLNHRKAPGTVSDRAIKDAGNEMIHKDRKLVCYDGAFYTTRAFKAELGAAAMLVKLSLQQNMSVNIDRILRSVQQREKLILNAKQQEAIQMVFRHPVSIITGRWGVEKPQLSGLSLPSRKN